jgi:cytosine/uracil/thiamine/allantoin permease
MREFFNVSRGYRYLGGWNPGALIAVACGFATYLTILNPLTWESASGLFPYITAGLPTFIVTAIVYTVLMKVWVLKKIKVPFVNDSTIEENDTGATGTKG